MPNSNRQLLTRVSKELFKTFNAKIEKACLRRDAYLDRVFLHEAVELLNEVLQPNSDEARAFLQAKLEDLDRVPVNFSLSSTTIEKVNFACKERNVIRDCFINRVLFLLVSDSKTFEVITGVALLNHLGDILGDNDRDFLYAPLWDGTLSAVSDVINSDPFKAFRNVIEYRQEQGEEYLMPLHACVITPEMFSNKPQGVWALNCYLDDADIPDSPAQKAQKAAMEAALNELLGEPVSRNPDDLKSQSGGKPAT